MLKKKLYSEILKQALTRIQVMRLFTELYHPNEKYQLIVEPGAAETIKKIYRWYVSGFSTKEIAYKLNKANIMTPMLWLVQFCGFKNRFKSDTKGTRWTSSNVLHILKDERYTGKCIYGKTKVAKVGSRKLIKQPESEWFVVPNRFPVTRP